MKKLLEKIFIDFPESLDLGPVIFWLAVFGIACGLTSIILGCIILGGIL